jgi:hypothetical protein
MQMANSAWHSFFNASVLSPMSRRIPICYKDRELVLRKQEWTPLQLYRYCKLALIFLLLCLSITIFSPKANAQTKAASCSQADVQTAINTVSSGATVTVPAGTCTWTNVITVTRAIHLQGAGVGSTVITGGIAYTPVSGEEGKTFEINGFTFQGTGRKFDTTGWARGSTPITGLKIHDNAFNGATERAIALAGFEFGVFYNNTFDSNFISVSVIGVGWAGESYPHVFGSANYPYFEDNTFGNGTGEFVSETGQGGRLSMRHNTITGYACSGCEVFDVHGDQNTGGGTISSEYYHNTIDVGASGTYRWMHHRGGQAVIMNNSVSRDVAFNFTEYRSWGGNGICTAYPVTLNSSGNTCSPANGTTCIEKQINNSFYFNNMAGGSQQTPTYSSGNGGSCGSDPPWGDNQYIQQNREFWLPSFGPEASLPTTCTAGNTFYGSTDTDKIFKCTATNSWSLFYQPYTYPHPLRRSGSASAPNPPTNLTTVVN